MAWEKRNYVDGQTIITAQNLNDIQDAVKANETNKADKTATVSAVTYTSSTHKLAVTKNGATTNYTLGSIIDLNISEVAT